MISYCGKCNKEVEYSITESKILMFKGIKIDEIEQFGVCNECGEKIYIDELEDENAKRIYSKYRDEVDMISPSEVNRFRELYDLTNGELALITGCTVVLFSCMDDTYLQSKQDDEKLKVLRKNETEIEGMLKERISRGLIDEDTYKAILSKIKY